MESETLIDETTTAAAVAPAKGRKGKKAAPKGKGAKKKTTAKAKKTAKATTKAAGKPKAAKATKKQAAAPAGRDGGKKAIVLDLLGRKTGATLAELMAATGWQAHSVRGFISGQVTKKMGLAVESTKTEAGERTYRTA